MGKISKKSRSTRRRASSSEDELATIKIANADTSDSESSDEKPKSKRKPTSSNDVKKEESASSEDSYEGPIDRFKPTGRKMSSSSDEVYPSRKNKEESSESDSEEVEEFKSDLPKRTLLLPVDIMTKVAQFTNSIDLLN